MSHRIAAHRDDALGDQRVIIGRTQDHHVASRDEVEPRAHPVEEDEVAHLPAGAAVVLARDGGMQLSAAACVGWLRSVVRTATGARKLAALSARSRGTVGSEATSEWSPESYPRRRRGERSSKQVSPLVVANTSVRRGVRVETPVVLLSGQLPRRRPRLFGRAVGKVSRRCWKAAALWRCGGR